MKATPSKDGQMRFTVTIKHRVSGQDFVNALGWKFVNGMCDEDVETLFKQYRSRAALLALLKETISHEGDGFWTWSDGRQDSESIRGGAIKIVSKAFPELTFN